MARIQPGRGRAGRSSAVQTAVDAFRDYLGQQGLRFTHEREEVLSEFLQLDTHVEAEELLLRLRAAGSAVSRATIYRTLDLLVQAGLGRKVRLGTDHYYYEHVLGARQHEHMICVGCGKIIEWFDRQLDEVLERNLERQRFVATRYTVQVFGYCYDCAPREASVSSSDRSHRI